MEPSDQKHSQYLASWITSLAVSITCCAILFVIFAGYLADINKSIAVENIRLEEMAEHETQLLSEIQYLRHTIPIPPAAQPSASTTVIPTEPTAVPVGTAAPSVAPLSVPSNTSSSPALSSPGITTGTTAPTALTPSITTPSSPSTPASAPTVAPIAIPEVPAGH